MRSCPHENMMGRFLAEELPAAELAELDAHVEACPACQQTLNHLTHDSAIRPRMLIGANGLVQTPALRPDEALLATPPSWSTSMQDLSASSSTVLAAVLAPAQGPGELGRIGAYRILKVLGQGGMGIVLQAEDLQLGRLVALKVMRPEALSEPDARARFLREARACAALKHDHVITIHQVGEERGVPYMATELLEGMPLDQWLKSGRPLTLTQILRIGRETAKGLAAAHAKGLVHRDIKPGNLWLDRESGRVKILDFGLARPQQDAIHLTQAGYVLGTPAYMAPEQARNEAVDERSDLFSLGVVLYRLCTGQMPFQGDTTLAVLSALAVDTPRPARDVAPTVPLELSELIDRLLAKQPKNRPASARAVVEALQAIERTHTANTVATPPAIPVGDLTARQPQPAERSHFAGRSPSTLAGSSQPLANVRAVPARLNEPRRQALLIGLPVALLAGVALCSIIILIRNNDGTQTKVEVPDGATVDVLKVGKQVASVAPSPAEQLAVVQWLMEEKRLKQIKGEKDGQVVRRETPPSLPFTVRGLNLHPTFCERLTPEELQRLNVLVDLEGLCLYGQPLTDEGLAHLAPLVHLQELDLSATKVTPAAVQTLRRFPKLEDLRGAFGSEEWLKGLAQLPELRALRLFRAHLSDQSLKWIKDYPKLIHLNLAATRVSEADLHPLKEARQLRLLEGLSNSVPKETVERLAKAMPWCEIHHSAGNPAVYNPGKADGVKSKE